MPTSAEVVDFLRTLDGHQATKSILQGEFKLDDETYRELLQSLTDNADIVRLRGRNGGLKLFFEEAAVAGVEIPTEDEIKNAQAQEAELAEETEELRETESKYYPAAKSWVIRQGYETAEIIGDNTPRERWENPDVIGIYSEPFRWLVGSDLEVICVEVKLSFQAIGLWQAAHYRRFSHYVYLACAESANEIREERRLLDLAIELGVGILAMRPAGPGGSGISVQEVAVARRQTPIGRELDQLISDYEKILGDGLTRPGSAIIEQMSNSR